MTARTCFDCWRAPVGRGRCTYHLERWLNANPDLRMDAIMRKSILEAMPATQGEIAQSVGCMIETVRSWLDRLAEEKAIHIESYNPPTTTGTKWAPVYAAGPGEDAKVTKAMKREHHLQGQRAAHARRMMIKRAASLAGTHGWASGLMNKDGRSTRGMLAAIREQKGREVEHGQA